MRFVGKAIGALALVLGTWTGLAGVATANQVEALLQQEERGLEAISRKRMQDLVTAPVISNDTVKLSRAWVDNQPKATGGENWECLAEALYFEARGETVKGQFAVAEVILNRVRSDRFPGSACGVIRQGTGKKYQCQFTYTCDGYKDTIKERAAYERVAKVARVALDGKAPKLTDGATHYHTNAVRPRWSRVFTKTAAIGVHIFYRPDWKTASN